MFSCTLAAVPVLIHHRHKCLCSHLPAMSHSPLTPGAALPIAIPKDIPIVAPMKTSIVWVSYRQNSVEDNERNNSNDSIFFYSTYLSFLCLHIISFINSLGNVNKIMLHRFICFFGSLNILCANSKCHFIIHCGARLVSVPL